MRMYFFSVLIFVSLIACQSEQTNQQPQEQEDSSTIQHQLTTFELLDTTAARQMVVQDQKESYFEKVTPLEISIQLQTPLDSTQRRAELLSTYKQFLQEDVQAFSESETKFVEKHTKIALDYCAAIDTNLKLPPIKLIKTKGRYYGPNVYYTRDNAIVIPQGSLSEKDSAGFVRTMIHEIFHIYSRYNTQKRDSLYAAIGFKAVDELELSPFLQKRVLYNPDGVDLNYIISLADSAGNPIHAVPVIYSKFDSFEPDFPQFMRYIVFQLFEVKKQDGRWKVVMPNVGYQPSEIQGFWEQVGENTNYIWHPDEILADNFVLLALQSANKMEGTVPTGGMELLETIKRIIKE